MPSTLLNASPPSTVCTLSTTTATMAALWPTKFCAAYEAQQQKLTFCGVNAHFQNGIAEQAILDLLEGARKQLLQVCQR